MRGADVLIGKRSWQDLCNSIYPVLVPANRFRKQPRPAISGASWQVSGPAAFCFQQFKDRASRLVGNCWMFAKKAEADCIQCVFLIVIQIARLKYWLSVLFNHFLFSFANLSLVICCTHEASFMTAHVRCNHDLKHGNLALKSRERKNQSQVAIKTKLI